MIPVLKISSINPLSDFVRNTKACVEGVKASHKPQIMTVNGEASVVVQDAASYEKKRLWRGRDHGGMRLMWLCDPWEINRTRWRSRPCRLRIGPIDSWRLLLSRMQLALG